VESNSGISINSLLLNQLFNFLSKTPTTPTGEEWKKDEEKDKKKVNFSIPSFSLSPFLSTIESKFVPSLTAHNITPIYSYKEA
jgi:hypothetical protein